MMEPELPNTDKTRIALEETGRKCINNDKDDADDNGDVESPWACLIPEEVLLKVFNTGAQYYGSVPFLCRVAQVCRRWMYVAYHPSLWDRVDLSIGWIARDVEGLQLLCETRLFRTRSINLTSWFKVDDRCLQCLAENCNNLTSLNLSHCEQLTPEGLLQLGRAQLPLQQLDLSFTSPAISSKSCMKELITSIKGALRKLILAHNLIDNDFSSMINFVAQHCPKLEYLDISHLGDTLMTKQWVYIDMEHLQEHCPNLQVLLMAKSPIKLLPVPESIKAFSAGFPKLLKFSAPACIKDDLIERTLKSSFDLESLKLSMDLANDVHYCRVPATSLKTLVVHRARDSQLQLRWHHSLAVLDFSWIKLAGTWNTSSRIETVFSRLFDPNGPQFEVLHTILLCGSPISVGCLRPIFESCPRLQTLNLLLCGLLPLGWHQEFTGNSLTFFKHNMLGLPLPGS